MTGTDQRTVASPWIESSRWDALWMFSGLWAPMLAVAAYFATHGAAAAPALQRGFGATVEGIALIYLPLSVLHRITTTYAVLTLPGLRADVRKHRARYLYVPLAICCACVLLALAFTFHAAFAFLPSFHLRLWGFFVLAYVMFIWERWHFCAQEFGVLSIYRVRAKQSATQDKRFDRLYTVVLMLGVNTVLVFCAGFADLRQVVLHGTPLSGYRGELLAPIALAAFGLGASLTAVAMAREWRHPQRSLPKLLFYLLVGGHSILLYWFPRSLGLFFLSYAFHHWMVSVGLFGRITLGAYAAQAATPGLQARSPWVRLGLGISPFLALAVFLYVTCDQLDRAGSLTPLPDPMIFAGASAGAKVFAALIIGTFFALNYLHYYYDRCFYAFSTPVGRTVVAPLLFRR